MQFPLTILQRCWFLAGPTACGKTDVSLRLAETIDAEILALDSMTLYRSMDVGTAKATPAQQQRVPHHLLNVLDPHEEFSTADYLRAAEKTCGEILNRGRVPLFVGGTGLYLRSLLRGVFDGPPADWTIRNRWESAAMNEDSGWLHRELENVDPATAKNLHPNDHRRVIRALEVFELTGRPLSQQQQHAALDEAVRPRHVFWLSPPREWLHDRINRRVGMMFEQGLLAEIERLRAASIPLGRTARQALGYKEVLDRIENQAGQPLSPQQIREVQAEIQLRTRQFAKRQETWFRNLEECQPVPIAGTETVEEIVLQILRQTQG